MPQRREHVTLQNYKYPSLFAKTIAIRSCKVPCQKIHYHLKHQHLIYIIRFKYIFIIRIQICSCEMSIILHNYVKSLLLLQFSLIFYTDNLAYSLESAASFSYVKAHLVSDNRLVRNEHG